METNLGVRRFLGKATCAILVWLGATAAVAFIDVFLDTAWGFLPIIGVLYGSGYVVYRLVREDEPEGFLDYFEVCIYAYIIAFAARLATSSFLH
jgi:hypothetical protein